MHALRPMQSLAWRCGVGPRAEGAMIAVIFEVWPKPELKDRYLAIAAELRAQLEALDGFISVERFESLSEPGKILSLSFFRDQAAVAAWRNTLEHRAAQAAGRAAIFADYRLSVAEVVRDYGMTARDEAPGDSRGVHAKASSFAGPPP